MRPENRNTHVQKALMEYLLLGRQPLTFSILPPFPSRDFPMAAQTPCATSAGKLP